MTDSKNGGKTASEGTLALVDKVRLENRQVRKLVEDLVGIQEREVAARQRLIDHVKRLEERLESQREAQLSAEQVSRLVQSQVRDAVATALAEPQPQAPRRPMGDAKRRRTWMVALCIALVGFVATAGYLAAPLPSLADIKQRFLTNGEAN